MNKLWLVLKDKETKRTWTKYFDGGKRHECIYQENKIYK